jgi:hypothetical protein
VFCPNGFIHVHEVQGAAERASWQIVPYVEGKEFVWLGEIGDEIDYDKSNSERRLIIENFIFVAFIRLNHGAVFACSPTGEEMKLSPVASRPLTYNLSRTFDEMHRNLGGDLLFINVWSGTIDPEGVQERMRKIWPDITLASWELRIEALRPFKGWAMCFRASEVDVGLPAMIELWERPRDAESVERGRPRIQEKVLSAYNSVFPDGHHDLGWKEVLLELEKKRGVSARLDTLKRALGLRQQ